MDPDANLAEQIDLACHFVKIHEDGGVIEREDAARLAELVIALDEWIASGGFLPQTWQHRA